MEMIQRPCGQARDGVWMYDGGNTWWLDIFPGCCLFVSMSSSISPWKPWRDVPVSMFCVPCPDESTIRRPSSKLLCLCPLVHRFTRPAGSRGHVVPGTTAVGSPSEAVQSPGFLVELKVERNAALEIGRESV